MKKYNVGLIYLMIIFLTFTKSLGQEINNQLTSAKKQKEKKSTFGNNAKAGNFTEVNGIKIYYEIYGKGQPLVVLHGNGGSIKDASIHYPELIKKYKVITIDNRAHGKSEDGNEELSYELMASDVNSLLTILNIDSAYIWGHSDGAIMGLILAMDYPKKVKKLLAYGGNVQADSTAVYNWAIEGDKKAIKELDPIKENKQLKLMQLMLEHPKISFTKLNTIKIPVLIMAGDRDVIRTEHSMRIFENIPRAHLCILPGTTHGGAWEKKELFLKILFDFFENSFTMPTSEDWYK